METIENNNNNTKTYYHSYNTVFGYEIKVVNCKIIPVKHLTLLDMLLLNTYVSDSDIERKIHVTEKTIEKYNIDVNKTYVGSFKLSVMDKVYLPTIVNLNYDNGIPLDAGSILIEEKEKQINEIHNTFVNQYGPNFMDNIIHKLNFINLTKDIDPYVNNDFNKWKNLVINMKPMNMKGVILHKDISYESLFNSLDTLSKALWRPRNKRPVSGKDFDTHYVESYDGITDFYDYGLDHEKYNDQELYDNPHYPYMSEIDTINFKQV